MYVSSIRQLLPTGRSRMRNQHWQQLDDLAVHNRIIDRNAELSHHVFEVPQAKRIGYLPAH